MAGIIHLIKGLEDIEFDFGSLEEVVIGRQTNENTPGISINDKSVSRQHAKIFYSEGDYYLVDLGSSNGTKVGERTISSVRYKLRSEEYITFGRVRYQFWKDEDFRNRKPEDEITADIPLTRIFPSITISATPNNGVRYQGAYSVVGDIATYVFNGNNTDVKFGSGDGNQVIINGDGISKNHARVIIEDGKLYLSAIGNAKVSIDGLPLGLGAQVPINGDLTLGIGKYEFSIRFNNPAN